MAIWNGIEQRSVLYYTWAAAGARPLLVYRTFEGDLEGKFTATDTQSTTWLLVLGVGQAAACRDSWCEKAAARNTRRRWSVPNGSINSPSHRNERRKLTVSKT